MTTTSSDEAPVDALTPRQEDIIRLVAAGRPDSQIAYKLILTVDGVENHMTKIIAQLGAESREEAVAIWREQHRGERTRTIIKRTAVAAGLVAIAVAIGAFLFIARDDQAEGPAQAEAARTPTATATLGPPTPPPAAISTEQLLTDMETAVREGGEIFHVRTAAGTDTLEAWFDFAGGRMRIEHRSSNPDTEGAAELGRPWRTLVLNGNVVSTNRAPSFNVADVFGAKCFALDSSLALAMLSCGLNVRFYSEGSNDLVTEDGFFQDSPAFILHAEWPTGRFPTPSFRLFVDKESLLPMGFELGTDPPIISAYTWEFITAGDLAPDFFLSRSLGYPDSEEHAAAMLTSAAAMSPVYWLGATMELDSQIPALDISRVVSKTPFERTHSVLINYGLSEHGAPLANLERWSPEGWKSASEVALDSFLTVQECIDEEIIELGDRSIRILKNNRVPLQPTGDRENLNQRISCGTGSCATPAPGRQLAHCESVFHNRFMAVVTFSEAVIVINNEPCPFGFCSPLATIEPSLNTRDGVLAMAIALTLYTSEEPR